MRYVVAMAVAAALIAVLCGGSVFLLPRWMAAVAAEGRELAGAERLLLQAGRVLGGHWYMSAPGIVAVCFGFALVLGRGEER